MQDTNAPAIYIASDRITTLEEKQRLERLLSKIHSDMKVMTTEKELYKTLLQWYSDKRRTGQKKEENPNVMFTAFDWTDERNDPLRKSKYEAFIPGKFAFADFRDKQQLREERGVACNSGYEIHTAFGCLHSCSYCHIGNALTIMLDVETFMDKLKILMENNPWQKLYKYDNQTDILTMEPEYGASKKLVEFFSRTDKTLMLYTKSNNVDFLLDLEHKGRTKVCWTITCQEAAEKYERGAPTTKERIEAARKCQEAGYGIRFRFSPIIPIRNWKEKNAEMIEQLLSQTRPEVISLEMLCHMSKEQYEDIFSEMGFETNEKITEYELFPHETRLGVYKFFIEEIRKKDSNVKIALCLETDRMWKDLKGLLNGDPNNFYCCCGAKCA